MLYRCGMAAERDIRLTATSHIVLGLVAAAGGATPYDLKRIHAAGVGNFWSLNHAQLYAEPDRLAAAGYLSIEQEKGGRRRKSYELTPAGRSALDAWLSSPTAEFTDLRDPGLLQLFFGAEPRALAGVQRRGDAQRPAGGEQLHAQSGDRPGGPRAGGA